MLMSAKCVFYGEMEEINLELSSKYTFLTSLVLYWSRINKKLSYMTATFNTLFGEMQTCGCCLFSCGIFCGWLPPVAAYVFSLYHTRGRLSRQIMIRVFFLFFLENWPNISNKLSPKKNMAINCLLKFLPSTLSLYLAFITFMADWAKDKLWRVLFLL